MPSDTIATSPMWLLIISHVASVIEKLNFTFYLILIHFNSMSIGTWGEGLLY